MTQNSQVGWQVSFTDKSWCLEHGDGGSEASSRISREGLWGDCQYDWVKDVG